MDAGLELAGRIGTRIVDSVRRTLVARIRMKDKGDSIGKLFAGNKQVGQAAIYEDTETEAERRKRYRYRPPNYYKY